MIGKTLGHYEITDKLGQGGMGREARLDPSKRGSQIRRKLTHFTLFVCASVPIGILGGMNICSKNCITPFATRAWPSIEWRQQISGTNTSYDEGDWISYAQSRHIHSLQISPDRVYAATEGGILRYDLFSRKWLFPFTMSNGLAENVVLAVAYNTATNLLWCSTPSAISVYDRASRTWRNSYLEELGLDPDDPILSIGFSNRRVWLESRAGRTYSSPLQMSSLTEANPDAYEEIIWYGSRGFVPAELQHYSLANSMLFIADASDYYVQDRSLRSFRFNYYASDPWQTLWLGSSGLGMFSADRRSGDMVHLPYGLLSPDVKAIHKQGQEIWIGGVQEGGELSGLTLWQPRRDRWIYFEPRLISRFRGNHVLAVSSAAGAVWFGTEDGLVRYQRSKDSWRTYTTLDNLLDNRIHSLAGDESTLWVGSNDGLDRISQIRENVDSLAVAHITDPRDQVTVYDILRDDPIVWAGTSYGLFFYDLRSGESGYNREANGPGSEEITAVARSGDSLWVSTVGSVHAYDLKNRIWQTPPARKTFGGRNVNDIAVTDNAIWVGTDDGLFKFDQRDEAWMEFTVYDGLLDSIVQKIVPDGDYLLIGSPKGLTRFYWNSPYRIDGPGDELRHHVRRNRLN